MGSEFLSRERSREGGVDVVRKRIEGAKDGQDVLWMQDRDRNRNSDRRGRRWMGLMDGGRSDGDTCQLLP